MPDLKLSVLDQSPISEGMTGADALRNSIELAKVADRLGYERLWVAEHHGTPMLACAAPEVLIGPLAAATHRIRLGSGGVMLPHYSPVKVAESFSILAGLYGDRIDLGIGRAPGTDQLTMHALQRDRSHPMPDDFPQQLAELLALIEDRMPPDHPFARLAKLPGGPDHKPAPWLLGSSPQSAIWAGELGLPYAFADFINSKGAEIADLYRQRFVDSARLAAPKLIVSVWAIAADTDEEAQALAASSRMAMDMLRQGRLIPVPPVEQARRYLESRAASPIGPQRRQILGTPETVKAGIEEAAAEYGADEVSIVTITFDHAARMRSYELIAGAFGLEVADAEPAALAR